MFAGRFPDVDSPYFCPPPDAKETKSVEYKESLGVLGLQYDMPLHFAIAHMRRADGALPPNAANGRKALDLLGAKGSKRYGAEF